LPEEQRNIEDYHTLCAAEAEVISPGMCAKDRNFSSAEQKRRFKSRQQKVLFTAWKMGFLCDNKNYLFLSEITGLSRKQISN